MGFKCLYPSAALKCAHECVQGSEQLDNKPVPFFVKSGKLAGRWAILVSLGARPFKIVVVVLLMLMLHRVRAC